jgi:Uma2 family endonuclease
MTAVTQLPPHSPPLMRISCERYHEMIASGGLKEDDRIELIHGYLVTKMSIGSHHSAVVSRLERFLHRIATEDVIVRGQNPITIHEYSEPEPDVVIAKYRADFYAQRNPYPEDILLVVEVADTSLAYDRDAKIPLYAACGIPESWLIDLNNHQITVFRQPDGAAYTEQIVFRTGDAIPVPGSTQTIAVADLGL